MRLFIAIELPRSFKQELARVQKEVKQMSCGGRFVPQENFHITLHFIGESDDLAGAVAAMREANWTGCMNRCRARCMTTDFPASASVFARTLRSGATWSTTNL